MQLFYRFSLVSKRPVAFEPYAMVAMACGAKNRNVALLNVLNVVM